jgi:hypothetical protein
MTCCISIGGERPTEAVRWAGHQCASEMSKRTSMDGDYDAVVAHTTAHRSKRWRAKILTRTTKTAGDRTSGHECDDVEGIVDCE